MSKSAESLELITALLKESWPPSSTSSMTREFWLMEKVSKDKSSLSPDFNSPSKCCQSAEESETESSEKLSPNRMSKRTSMRAPWEPLTSDKPEENNSTISRDSKF